VPREQAKLGEYAERRRNALAISKQKLGWAFEFSPYLPAKVLPGAASALKRAENAIEEIKERANRRGISPEERRVLEIKRTDLATAFKQLRDAHKPLNESWKAMKIFPLFDPSLKKEPMGGPLNLSDMDQIDEFHSQATDVYRKTLVVNCLLSPGRHRIVLNELRRKVRKS